MTNEAATIRVNPDTPEFLRWQAACVALYEKHMADNCPNNPKEVLLGDFGRRYVKIHKVGQIDTTTGRPITDSAWAFVDRRTGDILRPASWSAPAKHARGNIFDSDGGMRHMSWLGPAYLR